MSTSKVDEDPQTVDLKKYRNIEKTIFIAGYCIFIDLAYSKD